MNVLKLAELINPRETIKWSLSLDRDSGDFVVEVERGGRTQVYTRKGGPGGLDKLLLKAQRFMVAKVRRGYRPVAGMACPAAEVKESPYTPHKIKFPCYAQPLLKGTPFTYKPGIGLSADMPASTLQTVERILAHMPSLRGVWCANEKIVITDLESSDTWDKKMPVMEKLGREAGNLISVVETRLIGTNAEADIAHQDYASLGHLGTIYLSDQSPKLVRLNVQRAPFPIVAHDQDRGGVVWVCETEGRRFKCKLGNASLRKAQLAHAPYFYGRSLVIQYNGWLNGLPRWPKGLQFA